MKPVPELNLGYLDAGNYRRKEDKDFLNRVFLITPQLQHLLQPNIFFLVGEKGTGKTAYAAYLSNSMYKGNVATLRFIRETEYQKFVSMKQQKQLDLSDYVSIWKVAIYLLLAQQIRDTEKHNSFLAGFQKFSALSKAIDSFYRDAFSPEIVYAIQFAQEAELTAELISKFATLGSKDKSTSSLSASHFQVNLLYIQKQFEEALGSLRPNQNHILFIDGIDLRPETISKETYLECIKGLANAVWSVNNDFLANIKHAKKRLRVVLLVRPDVFNSLGLQNQNSKIRDNSVVLNWLTTYTEYRTSALFQMADHLLNCQQETPYSEGTAWEYYFPYDSTNVRSVQRSPSSFITFLRYSLYRPRNLISILSIQKENFIEEHRSPHDVFRTDDFTAPAFTRRYSDYVLGEVRDHIIFYYSLDDYEIFLKFFQFLCGKTTFTYTDYLGYFAEYTNFLKKNGIREPGFCETADTFLQFLYDLNVLGYAVRTADETFYGWCHRERSPSNIAPKVRTNVWYTIHFSLMKTLDLGKTFIRESDPAFE